MKTLLLLLLSLAAAGVGTAHAQYYTSTVPTTTVLGGIVGAIIGGHNNDRWVEGAAIGATAGALVGSALDQPYARGVSYRQTRYGAQSCDPVYVNPPLVRYGYAPAPRVVYVTRRVPYCAPRAPVVVVRGRHGVHRPQAIVYGRPRSYR